MHFWWEHGKEGLFCLEQSQPGQSSQPLGLVSEAGKAAEGPGTWIFASVLGGCSLATDRGKLSWKLLQVWGGFKLHMETLAVKKQKQSKKLPAASSSWLLQLLSGPANIDDNVISEHGKCLFLQSVPYLCQEFHCCHLEQPPLLYHHLPELIALNWRK